MKERSEKRAKNKAIKKERTKEQIESGKKPWKYLKKERANKRKKKARKEKRKKAVELKRIKNQANNWKKKYQEKNWKKKERAKEIIENRKEEMKKRQKL